MAFVKDNLEPNKSVLRIYRGCQKRSNAFVLLLSNMAFTGKTKYFRHLMRGENWMEL